MPPVNAVSPSTSFNPVNENQVAGDTNVAHKTEEVATPNPELPTPPAPAMAEVVMIGDRECRPLKLGNGDVVYFIAKARGREYRLLKQVAAAGVDVQMGTNPDGGMTPDVGFDLGKYYDQIMMTFPYLAVEVHTASGEIIPPSLDYFDKLELADADLVSNQLEKLTNLNRQPFEVDSAKKK